MKPASPLKRIFAFLYDAFIVFSLLILGTYVLLPFNHGQAIHSGNHWYQIYLILIMLSYWVGFWYWRGQTLGMLAWNMKVTSSEPGKKLKLWQLLLRFFFGSLLFFVCLLFAYFNKKRLAIHDYFSNTTTIATTSSCKK